MRDNRRKYYTKTFFTGGVTLLMQKKVFLLVFAFIPMISMAQNFKDDYKRMMEAYKHLQAIKMNVTISHYENHEAIHPFSVQEARLMKDRSKFFLHFNHTTMLYTDSLALIINHAQKMMTLSPYDTSDFSMNKIAFNLDVDSIVAGLDSVKYTGKDDNAITYEIFSSKSQVSRTILTMSKENHLILKLTCFYNTKYTRTNNKVEITYSIDDLNPVFNNKDFTFEKYISISDDNIVPSEDYEGYRFILNFNEE